MSSVRFARRSVCAHILIVWILAGNFPLAAEDPPDAAQPPTNPQPSLKEYRSQFLIVYTDLPTDEAKQAMHKLERTLAQAAKYWGQDPRGQIECYLLADVEKISESDLPHRLARVLVGGVGGATLPNRSRSGKSNRNTPTVFASTRPGVAEHEIVHAYCTQTFGFTGPSWYSEGMAEMVVHRSTKDSGVRCSQDQIRLLRDSHRATMDEILAGCRASDRIVASLNVMLANPKNQNRNIPWSDWQQQDSDNVESARRDYLRSWALCYLLVHNPNYGPRFKTLGHNYVTTKDSAFASVFESMQKEIAFEYSFFLQNICVGYRVDLCSWDWAKRFRPLDAGESIEVKIAAGHGFQPSGLSVVKGQKYRFDAQGTWSTTQVAESATDGRTDLPGKLCCVVMQDFKLDVPILLGANGVFEATTTGNLYLRCHDAWNELHDNLGHATVRMQPGE